VKRAGKTTEVKPSVVLAAAASRPTPSGARATRSAVELAKVRGTRFNTGDASHGAGHRRGAVATGRAARRRLGAERTRVRRLAVGDQFQKHLSLGIYINADGKRFVDEGADFRNYTYAKYGA